MITASSPTRQPSGTRWQRELTEAISSPHELLAALSLDPSLLEPALAASATFPLRVPLAYLARMRKGDPDDPLLRQVLPLADELDEAAGFVSDPLGEREAMRAHGLLHKYQGRALLITTQACAVHCRYCFRREFPYAGHASEGSRWSEALATIASDTTIEEVILSGGDPLSLSDARLSSLTHALSQIGHVRRLRVHTRNPIVLPSRVDEGLLHWIRSLRWPLVFVLHSNHPHEIDDAVRSACADLRAAGVTLLNQTVLLKGVNDDVGTLQGLSEALFEAGVLPYYLHMLDRVRGAGHFEVSEERALQIALQLASRLPGYLVPKLVREVAGAPAKLPVLPRMRPF